MAGARESTEIEATLDAENAALEATIARLRVWFLLAFAGVTLVMLGRLPVVTGREPQLLPAAVFTALALNAMLAKRAVRLHGSPRRLRLALVSIDLVTAVSVPIAYLAIHGHSVLTGMDPSSGMPNRVWIAMTVAPSLIVLLMINSLRQDLYTVPFGAFLA